MSDFTGQQCNNCGAVNTTAALNWVRVFGVTIGASLSPIASATPLPGPRRLPMLPSRLDFCPACAAKITVAALPDFATKAATQNQAALSAIAKNQAAAAK